MLGSSYNPKVDTFTATFTAAMPAPGVDLDLKAAFGAAAAPGSLWVALADIPNGSGVSPVLGPTNCLEKDDSSWVVGIGLWANFADGFVQIGNLAQFALIASDQLNLVSGALQGTETWYNCPALNFNSEQQAPLNTLDGLPGTPITGRRVYARFGGVTLLDTSIIDPAFTGKEVIFQLRVQVIHSYSLLPTIPV